MTALQAFSAMARAFSHAVRDPDSKPPHPTPRGGLDSQESALPTGSRPGIAQGPLQLFTSCISNCLCIKWINTSEIVIFTLLGDRGADKTAGPLPF